MSRRPLHTRAVLRGVITSERARLNAPAVREVRSKREAEHRRTPWLGAAVSRLKKHPAMIWRAALLSARIAHAPETLAILPFSGHKYEEVEKELQEATPHDLRESVAYAGSVQPIDDLRTFLRSLSYALVMWLNLRKARRSRRLAPCSEVLLQALVLIPTLQRRAKRQHWFIIGDLTTSLIALAGACKLAGHDVIAWQYSFLDFKPYPVPVDRAAILNTEGQRLARIRVSCSRVYWRPRPNIKALRLAKVEEGPIGAFLNVHVHQRALNRLASLAERMRKEIMVRLHPNTSASDFRWPDSLRIVESAEPLKEFSERISLAICGNTQAQLKALSQGTPVVQCAGLDMLSFDHHGYVRSGIVPGIQEPAEFSYEQVKNFYSGAQYKAGMAKMMGPAPPHRHPGLGELLADLGMLHCPVKGDQQPVAARYS